MFLCYIVHFDETGTQWTPARQAGYVHCLMAAILMALLENLKQYTALLGQRYVCVCELELCEILKTNI